MRKGYSRGREAAGRVWMLVGGSGGRRVVLAGLALIRMSPLTTIHVHNLTQIIYRYHINNFYSLAIIDYKLVVVCMLFVYCT